MCTNTCRELFSDTDSDGASIDVYYGADDTHDLCDDGGRVDTHGGHADGAEHHEWTGPGYPGGVSP